MPKERRKSAIRRQFNAAFESPDGRISISKTIAVFSQITVLYHFGRSFDLLIPHPEMALILLAFLVCPDLVKKIIAVRYVPPPSSQGSKK